MLLILLVYFYVLIYVQSNDTTHSFLKDTLAIHVKDIHMQQDLRKMFLTIFYLHHFHIIILLFFLSISHFGPLLDYRINLMTLHYTVQYEYSKINPLEIIVNVNRLQLLYIIIIYVKRYQQTQEAVLQDYIWNKKCSCSCLILLNKLYLPSCTLLLIMV